MGVKFEDYTMKIKGLLSDAAIKFLYEAGGELQTQVVRNSRTDLGNLRRSWKYIVDENEMKVTVGSTDQNAIWEEFGTGEFALNGDGRKTSTVKRKTKNGTTTYVVKGWYYKDYKGEWHHTKGKKPTRALHNAFNKSKPKLEQRLETIMKEGG